MRICFSDSEKIWMPSIRQRTFMIKAEIPKTPRGGGRIDAESVEISIYW